MNQKKMNNILAKIKKVEELKTSDQQKLKEFEEKKKINVTEDIDAFAKYDLQISNCRDRLKRKDLDLELLRKTGKEFIVELSMEQVKVKNIEIQKQIDEKKAEEKNIINKCAELQLSMEKAGMKSFPDQSKISRRVKELKKEEKAKELSNDPGNPKSTQKQSKKTEILILQGKRKTFYQVKKDWKPAAKLLFPGIDFQEMVDLIDEKKAEEKPDIPEPVRPSSLHGDWDLSKVTQK